MKILVTSGGNREAIDGVRFITNFSTGRTGFALAETFAMAGHAVTHVHGAGAPGSPRAVARIAFGDFASLDRLLRSALATRTYDAIVHLAAVADYSVASVRVGERELSGPESARVGKLPSTGADTMDLRLVRNPKIVDRLREYAGNELAALVAFKLTNSVEGAPADREAAVARLYAGCSADWIVHNDLGERRGGSHAFRLYAHGKPQVEVIGVDALARALVDRLESACALRRARAVRNADYGASV